MRQDLSRNWEILQDVHDTCEQLGLPEHEEFMTLRGPQISEWEPLPELRPAAAALFRASVLGKRTALF